VQAGVYPYFAHFAIHMGAFGAEDLNVIPLNDREVRKVGL